MNHIKRLLLGLVVFGFRVWVITPIRVAGDVLDCALLSLYGAGVIVPDLFYDFSKSLSEVAWTLELWGMEAVVPTDWTMKDPEWEFNPETEQLEAVCQEKMMTGEVDPPQRCIYCDAGTDGEGSDWIN